MVPPCFLSRNVAKRFLLPVPADGGFALFQRRTFRSIILASIVVASNLVWSASFPTKPVRIVTGAAGGSGDFASRVIAQSLTPKLGHQVIVDNRGSVAGEIVANAPADGYTVLIEGASLWLALLMQKTPYDPVQDFSPITLAGSTPNVLVVHPSLPVSSVKELIVLSKANPGKLNFASGGVGGAAHLAGELFKKMAGVDIVHVPFRGTGPAVIGLLGGQVQLSFINVAAVMPQVKAGRLRALAVASAQRSVLAPELPTVSASGVPGFESILLLGIFAPAKTPALIVKQLNQDINQILSEADVKTKFIAGGFEAGGGSAEHLAATLKSDMAKWGKIIKDANIRAD